jgi:two-component sensor histidine kinase
LINDEPYILFEDQKATWTNIPASGINLPYYKNSITGHFDIIKFLNPDDTEFSYKMEGFHNQWINNTHEGKAIFQNLKPGKYIFRIKLTDANNSSSTQELAINFTIEKPIWFRWWAILAILLLMALIIRTFVLLRTRSVQKKERLRAEIAERITEFELKALRSQMNPHFIFNAINSIQNYMLDNDIDAALNYLSDFAKLIRLTLDNVSKKRISLDDELNYLKYYIKLEQMRFDKKFELLINVTSEIENTKILIPSMILQPYIENSIKHGFAFKESGGIIKLEFKLSEDNILKCIIEDNGIGRKKSRELNKNKTKHQSKGTFITTERLALLNQTQPRKGYSVETTDLYDEFNLASGTRVEISIPI